jgi:hypothetical protein
VVVKSKVGPFWDKPSAVASRKRPSKVVRLIKNGEPIIVDGKPVKKQKFVKVAKKPARPPYENQKPWRKKDE